MMVGSSVGDDDGGVRRECYTIEVGVDSDGVGGRSGCW